MHTFIISANLVAEQDPVETLEVAETIADTGAPQLEKEVEISALDAMPIASIDL